MTIAMDEYSFFDIPVIYLNQKDDLLENLICSYDEEDIIKNHPHMLEVWRKENEKWAEDSSC